VKNTTRAQSYCQLAIYIYLDQYVHGLAEITVCCLLTRDLPLDPLREDTHLIKMRLGPAH